MGTPETSLETDTKLKRIAWLTARDPCKRLDCLMHHFNEASLAACVHELEGTKAVGIDGIDKAQYGASLEANLKDLVARMKRMAYRPAPVRQVRIPKEGKPGATRALGISTLEDKIVQKMMQKVLESIYEPLFLDCSYGFRPGRGCHKVETVIDLDLANFFGTLDHPLLVGLLRQKIGDERLIRYLTRMFKAGVMADGDLTVSEEGVPPGSSCSPVLANIVAHYVIDTWFETVVKVHCAGRVELFRYGDDAVICGQYERDAQRIVKARSVRDRYPLKLIWARFRAKIEGHNCYYGVSFNHKALRTFSQQARRILFKHLNRRSQRKSFTWEQLVRFMELHPLPAVRSYHTLC